MADADYETMPDDFTRALAIVAHPDDVEYGAAAAVATWTAAGRSVAYVLASRGEAGIADIPPERSAVVREEEQVRAAALVGVDTVEFLDHRDGTIEYGTALRRDLAGAIRRHRPELIVTLNLHDRWSFGGWNSPDHRNVGRAAVDAVGDAANRWIFPDLVDDGLEPWSGVRYVAISGSPLAGHAVDITDGLEAAIASLEAHAEYLRALGGAMADARTFLTGMARTTGERFGGRMAAAFELIPL